MDLLPNEDETMIADAARAFLAGELPIERLRPNAPPVDQDAAYRRMAELGWLGIGLTEEAGGSGMGLVAEALIQRECARHLASPSLLAAVLAAQVAAAAGDLPLARALAAGKAEAAIALLSIPGEAGHCEAFLFDGKSEAWVLAWTGAGMGLFSPDCMTRRHPDSCIDNSVKMEAGCLAVDAPRHWIGEDEAPLGERANVLLAAALTGLAERSCELTVEYAKVREQFGKSIGSFQAVKHRCADMAIRSRLAWHQTRLAALTLQQEGRSAAFEVASAKLVAGKAAHENARAAIQIHGGIGYQAECDVHWFMKRAQVYDRLGGAVGEQARRIARELSGTRQSAGLHELA